MALPSEFQDDDIAMGVRSGSLITAPMNEFLGNPTYEDIASLSTGIVEEHDARVEDVVSLSTLLDDRVTSISTVITEEVTTGLSSALSLVTSLSIAESTITQSLSTDIESAAADSAARDSSLSTKIEAGDTSLLTIVQDNNASLSALVVEADASLSSLIAANDGSLSTLVNQRVSSLSTAVVTGDTSLSTRVDAVGSSLTQAITAVQSRADSSVTSLSGVVNTNASAVNSTTASLSTAIATNISTSLSAVSSTIASLSTTTNSQVLSLSTLVGTGGSGVTSLSTRLDSATTSTNSALSSIVTLVGTGGSGLTSLSTLTRAQVLSLSTKIDTTPGPAGPKGETGPMGRAINLLGGLDNSSQLPPSEESELGDAYLIGTHFWAFVEQGWTDLGNIGGPDGKSAYDLALEAGYTGSEEEWLTSLHGADGIGLRILGSFPSVAALPQQNNQNGDAYIIAYQMWVWTGQSGWQPVGQVGPAGKSALTIAIENGQVPFGTTNSQFFSYLKGKSAYELVIQEGYIGTLPQWLASLEGPQGIQGEKGDQGDVGPRGLPAAAIRVLGQYDTIGELPQSGLTIGDAYFVLLDLYCWTGSGYQNLGQIKGEKGDTGLDGLRGLQGIQGIQGERGPTGASIYDVAVAAGYQGDVEAWLLSQRGPPGINGDQGLQGLVGPIGPQGKGLFPKGVVANAAALPAPTVDEQGWTYTTQDTKHLWICSGTAWIDHGDFTGPQGIQGIQGVIGQTGPAGPPIQITGTVANAGLLPAGAPDNVTYVTLDTGHFYYRFNASWLDLGPIKGDQGIQGIQGIQGVIGNPGRPLVAKGTVVAFANLPPVDPTNAGWVYNATSTGHMWISDGTQWVDMGDVRGIQGIQGIQGVIGNTGPQGAGMKLLGTKANYAALPASGNAMGDAWMLADTNHMWLWNGLIWVDAGQQKGATGQSAYEAAVANGFSGSLLAWIASLQGPQGIQGIQGTQGVQGIQGEQGVPGDVGPVGPGLTILGKKNNNSELPATGDLGSGYIIGLDFWVWTGAAFEDMGPVQGPKGDRGLQGIKGDQGIQGIAGLKGDTGARGTIWITLARVPGPADGSIGDYFINSTDNSYYQKTTATNWQALGNLGAGNVFDAASDGKKYVRQNGTWVELVLPSVPVLEAPLDNGYYTRRNGAWVAIQFPASDGNYYVYRNGAWVVMPAAPSDGTYYVQRNGAWVAIPAASTTPDLTKYTLAVAATTNTLDLATGQVFTVNASAIRTLAFANPPGAGKSMTVIISITGSSNITWPGGITWNSNTAPVLATTFTVVVLFWDGTGWKGGEGPKG